MSTVRVCAQQTNKPTEVNSTRRDVVSLGLGALAGSLLMRAGKAGAAGKPKTAEGALAKGSVELARRSDARKQAMNEKIAEMKAKGSKAPSSPSGVAGIAPPAARAANDAMAME